MAPTMIRNRAKRPRWQRCARIILAVSVLAGLASAVTPLATNASGPLCTLSCCAGRAPHAAGSCMNGTCHAFVRTSQHGRLPTQFHPPEQFCGLSRFEKAARSSFIPTKSTPDLIEFRSAFTRPCDADCQVCGAAAAGSHRGKNVATPAYRSQALPTRRQLDFRAVSILTFGAHCDPCAPRGPPQSLAWLPK
jgi:hypothetical protein